MEVAPAPSLPASVAIPAPEAAVAEQQPQVAAEDIQPEALPQAAVEQFPEQLRTLLKIVQDALKGYMRQRKGYLKVISDAMRAAYPNYVELEDYGEQLRLVFASGILDPETFKVYMQSECFKQKPDKNTTNCKLRRKVNDLWREVTNLAYNTVRQATAITFDQPMTNLVPFPFETQHPYEATKNTLARVLKERVPNASLKEQQRAAWQYAKEQKWITLKVRDWVILCHMSPTFPTCSVSCTGDGVLNSNGVRHGQAATGSPYCCGAELPAG
jgi:hypothetical protein